MRGCRTWSAPAGWKSTRGDGVIEAIAEKALRGGRLRPRERRRLMSYPLVIRLVIAMTLLPGVSYAEAMRVLAGLLADIPFTPGWHVPAGKTVTGWRLLVPAEVMEEICWHAAGPLIGDDEPSAVMLAGMPAGAADGMLVSVAESPANRAYFGTTGTAAGTSPCARLRMPALTARAGRALLAAATGKASDGEQTLLKQLAEQRPGVFAGRITCFDRNFPGYDLITAILLAGGHVIARVKQGIALPFQDTPDRGWRPGGSRVSWLNAPSGKKQDQLPVRVTGHSALVPGPDGDEEASQTCTLISTLPDQEAVPAGEIQEAYLTRWSASETTFGENRPRSPAPGTAPPAPCSGPAARSSCCRRPGPG